MIICGLGSGKHFEIYTILGRDAIATCTQLNNYSNNRRTRALSEAAGSAGMWARLVNSTYTIMLCEP